MPRRQLGPAFGRWTDTASSSDRLPTLSPRVAVVGLTAPPLAQLPDRYARADLPERSTRDCRSRTLSRLARPWPSGGDTRCTPLNHARSRRAGDDVNVS